MFNSLSLKIGPIIRTSMAVGGFACDGDCGLSDTRKSGTLAATPTREGMLADLAGVLIRLFDYYVNVATLYPHHRSSVAIAGVQ